MRKKGPPKEIATLPGFKDRARKGLFRSRAMKKNPTKAEKALAEALLDAGIFFEQQKYFHTHKRLYIADFRLRVNYGKLIIEIDGPSHAKQQAYDAERTRWLAEKRACAVIRFTNEQVLNDIGHVMAAIELFDPWAVGQKSPHDRPTERERPF